MLVKIKPLWHWWHGCAYDKRFPEYLPPREGVESFTNAIARSHEGKVRAIVCMNQRLWGMTTESWKAEGAEQYAVKGVNGTVHPEINNPFTKQPCASKCRGTPFWRNKYASRADGWQPIPLLQAVYHPYCILYVNYSLLTMPPYDDLWPAEFAPAGPLKPLDRKHSPFERLGFSGPNRSLS